jgi:hypothetical protein
MKARPERIRIRLRDDVAAGSTPLDLHQRRMWPAGLIVGAMFAIFAGVAWTVAGTMSRHGVRDMFDLMFVLFQGFWLLGWSVGVAILGALSVLLFFYGESARLQEGRLLHVPRFGPFKIILDYDLSRVRDVRIEDRGTDNNARVRFDYHEGTSGLGDAMPRADAERLAGMIKGAAASAGSVERKAPPSALQDVAQSRSPSRDAPPQAVDVPPSSLASLSGLALIGANLIPLAGVLFFGWDLASVLVLFWAESAVIAFYTAIKMVIVGKLAAVFAVPFFIGHFGGFMAMHFLFIYLLFVRGMSPAGTEPGIRDALVRIFLPIWTSLAVLFLSHGVSFFQNFLGRREYEATTMSGLMTGPYNRIIVMQLTLIFGGWIIMLLKSPVPALALLILLKTALDFTAHRKEHAKT